jgi:hypothetical protein
MSEHGNILAAIGNGFVELLTGLGFEISAHILHAGGSLRGNQAKK